MAFALVLAMEADRLAWDESYRPFGRKTWAGRRAHEALSGPRPRPTLAVFVLVLGTGSEERSCWPCSLERSSGGHVTTGQN